MRQYKLALSQSAAPVYASGPQTRRWVYCVKEWAKARGKNTLEVANMLGYKCTTQWYLLRDGTVKRVKLDILQKSAAAAGLDINYINGIYSTKTKYIDASNVFTDMRDMYAECMAKGNRYQAAQIVRKSAMFVFETLVPKDMNLVLMLETKGSEYESAKITCSIGDVDSYVIVFFGDVNNIKYMLQKKAGSAYVPVMEGDLDIHAVSAIKKHFSYRYNKPMADKKQQEKFAENARKMARDALDMIQ